MKNQAWRTLTKSFCNVDLRSSHADSAGVICLSLPRQGRISEGYPSPEDDIWMADEKMPLLRASDLFTQTSSYRRWAKKYRASALRP